VLDARTGRLVVRDSSSASIAAGDLAFPPGDSSLVTVSLDGVFRIWSARGSERLRFEAPDDPALAFTPDGKELVLAGVKGELIDAVSGHVVRGFAGFPAASVLSSCGMACVATSPGLGWLTYLDPTAATPRIVELVGRTGRQAAAVTVPRLDAQGVAPDGRIGTAYVNGDRIGAEIIDPRSRAIRHLATGPSSDGCAATTPSFTPDSRLMAVVDGCIHVVVWDLRSGQIRRAVTLPDRSNRAGAVISPDGRYVLVTVLGGAFLRIDVGSGRVAEVPGASAEGNLVSVAPDGRFFVVARDDGTVDIYDARTLRLVRQHALVSPIEALAFSPDSQELAVEDTSNVVRVWDTCATCENAHALAALAKKESVRELTPGERRTFAIT
jgi:WD40 repeat protein